MTSEESGSAETPPVEPNLPVVGPSGEVASTPPAQRPTEVERHIERRERLEREFLEVGRVGIFYAAMLGPILAMIGWVYHTRSDPWVAEYWGGGILYGVIAGFAWRARAELRGKFVWPKDAPLRIWAIVALTPVLTVVGAAGASYIWRSLHIGPLSRQALYSEEWSPWFCYLWVAVLPAFFEETAFRGILFEKLQRLMSARQAGWVTAIMFGVLHFNVLGLAVFLVPLALVAAWLTHRTRSLWPAILIHFMHNAAVLTLLLVGGFDTAGG